MISNQIQDICCNKVSVLTQELNTFEACTTDQLCALPRLDALHLLLEQV